MKYYVSGNTGNGFVNYLSSNVKDFNHVVILKHSSETLKTKIIQEMVNKYEKVYDIEILLSSIGKEFLEGLIVRDQSFAVVIDTIATPDLTGAIEVDLGLFLENDAEKLDTEKVNQINRLKQAAYINFATGLKVHDQLEDIYINEMDFERANQLADKYIGKILNSKQKKHPESKVFHRLFGTNTKDGVVNVVPEIISPLSTVYHVKGRAGTGKSTLMKKVMEACKNNGYDIELYHCSFDPDSVDMLLVRELDFCMFDSTDPHEFFPKREGESVIDLYQETVTPGTDEKYAMEIEKVHQEYKSYMKKGVNNLKEAGHIQTELEMNFSQQQDIDKIVSFIGKII